MCGKITKRLLKTTPKEGIGYKIFCNRNYFGKTTMNCWNYNKSGYIRQVKDKGWVIWDINYSSPTSNPDGFCLFNTKKEAKRFLIKFGEMDYETNTIRKVEYKKAKGIALHDGSEFLIVGAFKPTWGWRRG